MKKIISPLKLHIYSNIIFYILPGLLSLIFFNNLYLDYAFKVLFIIFLSSVFFYIGYFSIKIVPKRQKNISSTYVNFFYFLFFIYVLILIYIYSKNPPALFHVFSGDYQLINELRATATKNKHGIDSIVNAIYFTLSYVVLPSILLYVYSIKHKYRHLWFFIFTFILMLNMQKARILYLILPLFFLFMLYIPKKKILQYISILLVFLIFISNISGFNSDNFSFYLSDDIFERSTSGARFLFSEFNSTKFVINRILWIPYITAIDWISYFDNNLNDFLGGSTAPVFYKLFGYENRFLIENEVFKFEFNSGSGSLGTANSHFALDAYVNFGYLGVIIYSFFAGSLTAWIYYYLRFPINYISYNYAFTLTFSSLHANFLGAGIWFIIIIVSLFTILKQYIKLKEDKGISK